MIIIVRGRLGNRELGFLGSEIGGAAHRSRGLANATHKELATM